MDDSILQMFLEDTREHLTDIETDLLDIEEAGAEFDLELVNKVFRTAHSIKGSAAFLSLNNIRDLSHKIENVLDMIRSRQIEPTSKVVNITLRAFDRLEEMIDDINNSDSLDISEHVAALGDIVTSSLSTEEREQTTTFIPILLPQGKEVFSLSELEYKQAKKGGNFIYLVEYDLIHDVHQKGKTPLDLLKGLESSGRILDCRMDISTVGDLDGELSNRIPFYLLFATILEPDLVKAIFLVSDTFVHVVDDSGRLLSLQEEPEESAALDAGDPPDNGAELPHTEELPAPAPAAAQPATASIKKEWTISGAVSISNCSQLKSDLIEMLQTYKEICIDMSGITSADLAFLQLMVASIRTAREKGIELYCQGGAPEPLQTLAERAGIVDLHNDKVFKGFFRIN